MVDRLTAPAVLDSAAFDIRLKPYEKITLDNGIPVYLIPSDNQDTLMLELVFNAGNWYETKDLVATATNYLIKNGSSRHTALQINERVEFYGAFLDRSSHHEHASYVLHCLSRHFADLLPVVQEVITDPVFLLEELDIYRQNMKQQLSVNLRKCEFIANRRIDSLLFGPAHPYGRSSSMEAYDALQRDHLQEHYRAHYTYDNCTIFAAGLLPEGFPKLLNESLGKETWNGKSRFAKKDQPIDPAPEKKAYRITNDPQGVQGAVRIARLFPGRLHPDFPKMMVLNTIFGGYFGSRLMSNIREDKGYTYGIHSQLYHFRQQGALAILTEAGREVCEATVREIYREMELMTVEPVGDEELHLVRNYLIGSVLGDLDGSFQLIQRWRSLLLNGLDENYFNQYIHTVRTITAEELLEVARRYFRQEEFYELIVF
ncbi:MAG TPA: pitrilysin family protein [Chitinophagaceae bacterium]|nr:pitrilysin family protein [Chitinophagaceae bacterium]